MIKDPPEKIIVYGAFTFVRQPPPVDEKVKKYEKLDEKKDKSHGHDGVDQFCDSGGCNGLYDKKKNEVYDFKGFIKDYETFMDNMKALDDDRIIQRYISSNYSSSTCKMNKDQFMDGLKGTILLAENNWFNLEYQPQIYIYLTGHGCNIPNLIAGKEDYVPTSGDAYL